MIGLRIGELIERNVARHFNRAHFGTSIQTLVAPITQSKMAWTASGAGLLAHFSIVYGQALCTYVSQGSKSVHRYWSELDYSIASAADGRRINEQNGRNEVDDENPWTSVQCVVKA